MSVSLPGLCLGNEDEEKNGKSSPTLDSVPAPQVSRPFPFHPLNSRRVLVVTKMKSQTPNSFQRNFPTPPPSLAQLRGWTRQQRDPHMPV